MDPIFSALIPSASSATRYEISETLERFGHGALRFAVDASVIIRPLRSGQLYREASAALRRMGIDVDAWPNPPAGLFVVEERAVYLRGTSSMIVAHEFGHALDCALGGGVYRSGIDPDIRKAFAEATTFVTPYAATGIDEYFAEGMRAYVDANDPASHWPPVSRSRLRRVDPAMYAIVDEIFGRFGLAA